MRMGNIHSRYVGAAADGKTSTLMYAAGNVQQFSGGNGYPRHQSAFFYGDNSGRSSEVFGKIILLK